MTKSLLCGFVLASSLFTVAQAAAPAEVPDIHVPDEWFLLETKTVETVRDRESALSSGQMPMVARLAFLPVDGDLECERISVSFADGGSEWIELSGGTLLEQGKLYPVELQPDYQERELTRVNYTCSAVAGTEVALNIYAAE